MLSLSGGDNLPDRDPEKEAEGRGDVGDVSELAEPALPTHDVGDGADEVEMHQVEIEEEEEEELDTREGEEESDTREEEEEWDTREDAEGQEEEGEEVPMHVIEAEEIVPEEEKEEVMEEEVEEYEYTKEEIKYMKTAFSAYQIQKKQTKKGFTPRKKEPKEIKVTEIPINALGSVLRSLGLNPTQAALKNYANWLDADPVQGVVKFEQFLIIVGREKKTVIDESHVLEAFRSIDIENNQFVSTERLHGLLVLTGEKFSPEEWVIFVHLADPKKRGSVDYENFVARMGPNPPPPKKKKKGKKGKKKKKKKKRMIDSTE